MLLLAFSTESRKTRTGVREIKRRGDVKEQDGKDGPPEGLAHPFTGGTMIRTP